MIALTELEGSCAQSASPRGQASRSKQGRPDLVSRSTYGEVGPVVHLRSEVARTRGKTGTAPDAAGPAADLNGANLRPGSSKTKPPFVDHEPERKKRKAGG